MASLDTRNLMHISVCCPNTIQPMTRLSQGLHTKKSQTALIYQVTANSEAMIASKQEETGLEEEELS